MSVELLSVLLLDTKQNNPNYYIVLAIEQALRRHPQIGSVERADYATVIRRAQERPFDLLLAVDGEASNRTVLSKLVRLVDMAVLWCWEDPYETARTAELALLFDLVFTNDSASVGAYSQIALHLPLAASERRDMPAADAGYSYDVAFVGSAWPNRVTFLRKLLRARPNLRYRICLSYNEHLPNTYLDLPESSYAGVVSHHDFLHIANRSRINLALHRKFSGDGLSRRAATPGPRIFETALAGGFQLVDGDGMNLGDLYEEGKDISVFRGFEDALDKLDTMLAKPKGRMEMACAAQQRTAADHSYDARVGRIIASVGAVAATRLPAPRSSPDRKRRPRLLFVTHNRIANGNFGGVEVYQETISDQMRADYDIYFYQPQGGAGGDGSRSYALTDSRHRVMRSVTVGQFDPVTTLWHAASEDAFASVLAEFGIELVHFHHLINHAPSLPLVCRTLGIPSVYTFQDFWSVCSRFNLIDYKRQYCRPHERSRTACDVCLGSGDGRPVGSQAIRRSFFSEVLQSVDRVLFNSPSSAAICSQIFPELPAQSFCELGLPLPWTTMHRAALPTAAQAPGGPLRVVFLGNFTHGKGAETFLDLARFVRDDNIVFSIAGRADPGYGDALAGCGGKVTIVGEFAPGALDLTEFEVSLHLSVWPETYCITLSEAWKAGVLPVVSDCGALADRVRDGVDGFKVPIGDVGELAALLLRLEGNRRELAAMRANITAGLWLTPEQHCQTLTALYRGLLASSAGPRQRDVAGGRSIAEIHSALTVSRRFPPQWTQLDGPVLPQLPSPQSPGRNPLQRRVATLRAAFSDQAWARSDLTVWVDAFAGAAAPKRSAFTVTPWIPARPPIQLMGWLECDASLDEVSLVARSANGDLAARPVYLHERADLVNAGGSTVRLGFLTDPLAPELLQDGLYELAFALWRNGRFALRAINAAVACREELTSLIQTGPDLSVCEPFRGAAYHKAALTRECTFRFHLDDLSIMTLTGDGGVPLLALALRGWALDVSRGESATTLGLELRGPATYHTQLTVVDRPDVLRTFLRDSSARCGFEGAIWLVTLPRGSYELVLVRPADSSRFERPIGELQIGGSPADTYVGRPAQATEPALAELKPQ